MAKTSVQLGVLGKVLRRIGRYTPMLAFSLVLATVNVAMNLFIPILVGDAMVAVELDQGTHTVEFRYENPAFSLGWKISLVCLVLLHELSQCRKIVRCIIACKVPCIHSDLCIQHLCNPEL